MLLVYPPAARDTVYMILCPKAANYTRIRSPRLMVIFVECFLPFLVYAITCVHGGHFWTKNIQALFIFFITLQELSHAALDRQRLAAIVKMASDTNGHWAHGCRWWWWLFIFGVLFKAIQVFFPDPFQRYFAMSRCNFLTLGLCEENFYIMLTMTLTKWS